MFSKSLRYEWYLWYGFIGERKESVHYNGSMSLLRYTNDLRPRVPRCAPVRLEHWNLSLRYNIDTSKPHSNPVFLSVHNSGMMDVLNARSGIQISRRRTICPEYVVAPGHRKAIPPTITGPDYQQPAPPPINMAIFSWRHELG